MHENPYLRRRRAQRRAAAANGALSKESNITPTGISRINLALGAIVAATSVALAIAAAMQWMTMQTQTEQNNAVIQQMSEQQAIMHRQIIQTDSIIEQMRLEQRAWLGVQQPEVIGDLVAGEPVHYVLPVHNSGNTPGHMVEVKVRIVSRELSEDVGPTIALIADSDDILNQQTSIAPDATYRFLNETPERLGAPVRDAIIGAEPTRKLYLLGWFRYLDVTGANRFTHFCYGYDHESKKLIATAKYNVMD